MALMDRPVLSLNASYEPLTVIKARRALTLVSKGHAHVLVPTKRQVYPGIFLPSVIRLTTYHKIPHRMQVVTRKTIFVRDDYKCMYCGNSSKMGKGLELEHIIPRSKGGKSTWENLVASCTLCNRKKGAQTPEEAGMKLIRRPLPQTIHTPRFILRSLGSEIQEWAPYLWHDTDGDRRYSFQ